LLDALGKTGKTHARIKSAEEKLTEARQAAHDDDGADTAEDAEIQSKSA
jgi:hypothetical protein